MSWTSSRQDRKSRSLWAPGRGDGFAAVVLTCGNHDRDARWFGNQLKTPVLAPEGSPARAHKSVKRTFGDTIYGQTNPEGLRRYLHKFKGPDHEPCETPVDMAKSALIRDLLKKS